MGYTFNLGIETEFFILKDTEQGKFAPASDRDNLAKAAYDVPTLLDNYQIIDELVTAMNELGWDVYSFDHEDAQGQFEIDFNYSDALTMADRFTFFRLMAKEIAKKTRLLCFLYAQTVVRTYRQWRTLQYVIG